MAGEHATVRPGVLSTHVEVVRLFTLATLPCDRALHARGGGPNPSITGGFPVECSPRTWRWSAVARFGHPLATVLSTHVEVVRSGRATSCRSARALHARGGGPMLDDVTGLPYVCSPRTWRWSVGRGDLGYGYLVLSTHVEVVRRTSRGRRRTGSALHARGGGPEGEEPGSPSEECSPRTWRWSGRSG